MMLIGGKQEISMGECCLSVWHTAGGRGSVPGEKRVIWNLHGVRLVRLAMNQSPHYYFAITQRIPVSDAKNVNGSATSFQTLENITLVFFSIHYTFSWIILILRKIAFYVFTP